MDDSFVVEVVKTLETALADGSYLILTEAGEREREREREREKERERE